MELVEAVCANPHDAGLRAQLAQVMHNVEEATVALRALEVEWSFVAPPPVVP
jgi:thioredoxin-like negative regulator of GroEL